MTMIGQVVSHYKILEKLSEGELGIVYRAHDTKFQNSPRRRAKPRRNGWNFENPEVFCRDLMLRGHE